MSRSKRRIGRVPAFFAGDIREAIRPLRSGLRVQDAVYDTVEGRREEARGFFGCWCRLGEGVGSGFAKEELHCDAVFFGGGDGVFGGEVGGCGEGVEFADGGGGVVDVEVGEGGGGGAALETSAGERC